MPTLTRKLAYELVAVLVLDYGLTEVQAVLVVLAFAWLMGNTNV